MKTNLFYFATVVSVALLSSCSVYKYSSRVAETQTQNNIYITPSVVDVKIDLKKKITVVSNIQKTEDAARENAYYKAITDNDIDILVSPIYEIEIQSGGNCKATVTGFAGYFMNPRTVTEDKKLEYDAKLAALDKMLKFDPIVKEEQKTIVVTPGNYVSTNSGNGVTTISNPSSSLVEKFLLLYNSGTPYLNTPPVAAPSNSIIPGSILNLLKK